MRTRSDERTHEAETVGPSREEALGARVRAFLRGELMLADLCELTREEFYILSEQGRRLYQEGLLDESRRLFEALTVLEPGEGYFHSCLGLVQQQQGALDQARRAYDQAIELDETDVSSRCNRAEVLLQLGHLEAASEDLKRIAELDPEGSLDHSQRARGMALALGTLVQRAMEASRA